MKVLAIQFRYLGDAVLMTPALRALHQHFPEAELHVLVAREVAPLLQHLPWVHTVWAFPRIRGRKTIVEGWPVIRQLRRERFDRSVDFAGNDRGAITSLLCGARQRLGPLVPGGFLGRRHCYTHTIPPVSAQHEVVRNLRILSAWDIREPESPQLEIRADPAQESLAARLLPQPAILCHVSASEPRKEWPIDQWVDLHRQAAAADLEVVFSSGVTPRETSLLEELKARAPGARTIPPVPDLALFLAVLQRARLFISGDTGPLHFAAALGIPTISLFGPSRPDLWAPSGRQHHSLRVDDCDGCGGQTTRCLRPVPCLATIPAAEVLSVACEVLTQTSAGADPRSTHSVRMST